MASVPGKRDDCLPRLAAVGLLLVTTAAVVAFWSGGPGWLIPTAAVALVSYWGLYLGFGLVKAAGRPRPVHPGLVGTVPSDPTANHPVWGQAGVGSDEKICGVGHFYEKSPGNRILLMCEFPLGHYAKGHSWEPQPERQLQEMDQA